MFVGADDLGPSLPLTGLPVTVTIPAGATRVEVPLTITGDRRDDGEDDVDQWSTGVWLQGVRDAVGGEWAGSLSVRDDDPTPAIRISRLRSTVSEGGTLRWTLRVARPTDQGLFTVVFIRPPTGGVELTSADVPAAWFTKTFGRKPPKKPVRLSKAGVLTLLVPSDGSPVTLSVPTRTDRRRETTERLRLRIPAAGEEFRGSSGLPGLPGGVTLTGRVRDA